MNDADECIYDLGTDIRRTSGSRLIRKSEFESGSLLFQILASVEVCTLYYRQNIASCTKNGYKTAKINAKNFRGSLTTVVRAQNDTSKTANITDTIFDRTYWYSPCKRRRFENRSDQTFCILLIKDVLSTEVFSINKKNEW